MNISVWIYKAYDQKCSAHSTKTSDDPTFQHTLSHATNVVNVKPVHLIDEFTSEPYEMYKTYMK